jgi:hypothetical protein
MKKITSVLCFILLAAVATHAQDFKKFRVGLGSGYAMPGGDGAKGGVLFFMEPGYRINDAMLVNLRMEFAAMARGTAEDAGDADLDISTSGSYTLNGQYFFSNEGFRPFVGVGFGIYSLKAAKLGTEIEGVALSAKDESKIGFYPRVGFDAGHFQLSIDYNLIGKTEADAVYYDEFEEEFVTEKVEFKNSYLGIRFGVTIGGGRK